MKNGVNQSLAPGQTILYTWEDALGKRELTWSAGEKTVNQKNDLVKVSPILEFNFKRIIFARFTTLFHRFKHGWGGEGSKSVCYVCLFYRKMVT